MINLNDLKLEYGEYESIKITQEGSVAIGSIVALGFDIGFQIEGSLMGITATKGGAKIHHVYDSDDKTKCLNEFIESIRDFNKEDNG